MGTPNVNNNLSAAEIKQLAIRTGKSEADIRKMNDAEIQELLSSEMEAVDKSQLPSEKEPTESGAGLFVGIGAALAGLSRLIKPASKFGKLGKYGLFAGIATMGAGLLTGCAKERGCHAVNDENGNVRYEDAYGVRYLTHKGCEDEEGEIQQGSTFNNNIDNDVVFTIPLDALTAEMRAWMQQHHDDMQAVLAAIIANGATLQNVQMLMQDYGLKLDMIIELLMSEGAKLTDITALLRQMSNQLDGINNNVQDIKALLNKIDGKLGTITDQNSAQYKLLQRILAEIGRFRNDSNNDHARIIALLTTLVDKVDKLDNTVAGGFANVITKLGDMDYNAQVAVAEILAKLDTANDGIQNITTNQVAQLQKLADILAAIHAGNATMASGNATLVEIKNLIRGLDFPTSVNLETIESLLAQILARENANGDMLTNINNNTLLINASVKALKAQVNSLHNTVTEFSDQNHADLMAILNKIPTDISSCNCDCERIIELLEEIAERLGDGDYNHEGYRDDYDDILG